MHKIYRKKTWLEARIGADGAAVATLRCPTTPEWVDAAAQLPLVDAAVIATVAAERGEIKEALNITIPGAEVAALARWLARWTLDMSGVEIDDEPISWADLSEAERAAIWESFGMDDMTLLWMCVKAGRRGDGGLRAAQTMARAGLVGIKQVTEPPEVSTPTKAAPRKRTRSKKTAG